MSDFDTSVPKIEITATGPVAPEPNDILNGVLADFNASMGGNLNIQDLSTPQGQLAQSQAATTIDKDNVVIQVMTNINPDTASGVFQDAIGRIYLIDRLPSLPTVVICKCGGTPGTVIPTASQVQGQNNEVYISTGPATIGATGFVNITFQAVVNGPTVAEINSVNKIYKQIPGWDTVTNEAAGVVGRDVETRADFEYRRKNSVALNATGSLPAVRANVLGVENVIDVRTEENTESIPQVIGGVTLAAHSLYVAVVGGDNQAIAEAIWRRKGVGCDYNGTTTVTVQDTEDYNPPYPTYTVKFQRPTNIRTVFQVTYILTDQTPSNVTDLIQEAIINAWNGLDGGVRPHIGDTIYALRYVAPIQEAGDIDISTIELSRFGGTLGVSESYDIDEYPTLDITDITVVQAP